MQNAIATLVVSLYLLMPASAFAQSTMKGPLSYSLREYGVILGISLLGGFARWWSAVRKGDIAASSISALVGELATSALCGLLAFWICEALNLQPLYSAAAAGISGHAGAQGLAWIERLGKRRAEKLLGLASTEPAALADR